ncbi:MAG: aldolase/citrate lyase family protein [Acidobacteria bacterium]|nr:aldolase/citrate lyase family protein [Acidobacteriota bacterium]
MKIRIVSTPACRLAPLGLAVALAGCSSPPAGDEMPAEEEPAAPAAPVAGPSWNRVASLLAGGQVVFGIFSGERTPETAMEMARMELADFIFYSLERGPFDLDTMSAYQEALSPPDGRGAANPHPILLRIPPIRDGMDEAAERTAAALDAGVYGIVFPHVESAEESRHAVASMRSAGSGGLRGDGGPEAARVFGVSPEDYAGRADVWPLNPDGELVSMLLIEDKIGIENALEITSVPGISIVSPGPGDLRRAYEGDMEAVENAIQAVLAACLEADVPCGITAGPDDIAMRIEQGFRVFIVTSPEALAVGHEAAGR